MRNKNDLFTIWQAVDWLECKTWDKVDDLWIPADNDTTSMIYANKVIGDYELALVIFGVVTETNMYSVIETIGDICKEFSDTFYTVESSNSWLAEK